MVMERGAEVHECAPYELVEVTPALLRELVAWWLPGAADLFDIPDDANAAAMKGLMEAFVDGAEAYNGDLDLDNDYGNALMEVFRLVNQDEEGLLLNDPIGVLMEEEKGERWVMSGYWLAQLAKCPVAVRVQAFNLAMRWGKHAEGLT